MHRLIQAVLMTVLGLAMAIPAAASDVISMPLPPGFGTPQLSSDEISELATSMTASISGKAPQAPAAMASMESSLFLEGVDSLERYSAHEGRTRDHHLHGRSVSASQFQSGIALPMYGYANNYGYQPWGWGGGGNWGWWGPPIIVNNYCPTAHGRHGGVPLNTYRTSFVGLAVY